MGIDIECRTCPVQRSHASHTGHFFHWVERGGLSLEMPCGIVRLEEGDLAFTPGGTIYRIVTGPSQSAVLWTLRIRASAFHLSAPADADAWRVIMDLRRLVHTGEPRLRPAPDTTAAIADIFQRLGRACQLPLSRRRMCLKAGVLELLAALGGDGNLHRHLPAAGDPLPARLRDLLFHLEEHFTEHWPVARLAARMGLKPSQFHAAFRRHTGQSPVQYLTRLRIGHACRLLTETDTGIASIALASGYSSLSQFYAAFRSIMRCPPAHFRRAARRE